MAVAAGAPVGLEDDFATTASKAPSGEGEGSAEGAPLSSEGGDAAPRAPRAIAAVRPALVDAFLATGIEAALPTLLAAADAALRDAEARAARTAPPDAAAAAVGLPPLAVELDRGARLASAVLRQALRFTANVAYARAAAGLPDAPLPPAALAVAARAVETAADGKLTAHALRVLANAAAGAAGAAGGAAGAPR
jgi:hypothetical protein